jgi:translation initiation factor 1 (eIF-1/SUI1)
MATPVDTLLVRIEADMRDLKRDLNKVAKHTEKTGKRMESAFKKAGKAIASVASVAVLGSFIKASIQTGMAVENLRIQMDALLGSTEQGAKAFDAMTEFASKVPFSLDAIQKGAGSLAAASDNAEELSGLLQATGNIAALFGIPFNEAAANVQRAMSAGIGAADRFKNEGVSAFAGFEAGVSYTAEQTAKKLMDTFGAGGTADGAMDDFAKTSSGTLSMFQDAMFSMRRAFAESGLNDAFKNIVGALTNLAGELVPTMRLLGGIASLVGSVLAPVINLLADNLRLVEAMLIVLAVKFIAFRAGMALNALATAVFSGSIVTLTGAMKVLSTVSKTILPLAIFAGVSFLVMKFLELKERVGGFGEALGMIKSVFTGVFNVMTTEINVFQSLFKGFTMMIKGFFMGALANMKIKFAEFVIDVANKLRNMPMMQDKVRGLKEIGTDVLSFGREEQREAEKLMAAFNEAQIEARNMRARGVLPLTNALKALKVAMSPPEDSKTMDDALNETKANIQALEGAANGAKVATEDMKGALASLPETLPQVAEVVTDVKDKFTDLEKSFADAANGFADSLTQMVMNGKINFSSMKEMFKDMVRQMIADALKAQVIKPLIGGLFGAAGNMFGGASNPLGLALGNVGKGISSGQLAGGGSVNGGNPYLVGERGPELFVPNSSGSIMNKHNTQNSMGGGGTVVNQTINVQSGVAQTVRAEMISLLPRFKQDTMNAVVDAKRRGGSFGQAFG